MDALLGVLIFFAFMAGSWALASLVVRLDKNVDAD